MVALAFHCSGDNTISTYDSANAFFLFTSRVKCVGLVEIGGEETSVDVVLQTRCGRGSTVQACMER